MYTEGIDLEGKRGQISIQRKFKSTQIRIYSFLDKRKPGQDACELWKLPASITDEALFKIAKQVQRHIDGYVGTFLEVHAYYREMQRFQS